MALRGLNNTLKTSLVNNDAFNYAHLVKFEKPTSNELKGEGSNAAGLFSYITDAAFDIVFDDGSTEADGTANGSQNYIANKLTNVGSVTETVEAKASSMSITLDTSSLGASLTSSGINFAASTITLNTNTDLIEQGFREGDKVKFTLTSGSGAQNTKTVFINEITSNNVFTYTNTPEGNNITVANETSSIYTMSLASEELTGIIRDAFTTYTTYKNRRVFVYKVHCDPITNVIIGEPYLLFKGIVTNGSISEDPSKESKITWTLTSHWGDFSRVSGRLTLDEQHRALTAAGIPDQEALVRPEYAGDLGFIHANQAINVMATYNAIETSYKQVDINGFWFGGKRQREVEETVQRRVDLQFNLTPKYLPVVYGVNKIDSIPVFVDTDRTITDNTEVYVAYALAEGQISALFDIYIDGVGSICVDDRDSATRGESVGTDASGRFCRGRMDRGNTLVGTAITVGSDGTVSPNLNEDISPLTGGADTGESQEVGVQETNVGTPTLPSTGTTVNAASAQTGILHEQQDLLTSPMNGTFQFHAGKPDQNANPLLKHIAAQNKFKIGFQYYTGTAEYWGSNHRLLDTSYVVAKYVIAEGETTIPEVDFVVRGKGVECFNYDLSYAEDVKRNPANRANAFNLGDTVTLKQTSDDAVIASNVTIIDKWTFIDVEGDAQTRFRTNHTTEITVPHYMINSSNQKFHFAVQTGTSDVTRTIPNSTQLEYTFSSSELQNHTVGGNASGKKIVFGSEIGDAKRAALGIAKTLAFTGSGRTELLKQTIRGWSYDNSSNGTISNIGAGSIAAFDSSVTGFRLKDIIVLNNADDPSTDGLEDHNSTGNVKDDYYNGYIITLKRFSSTGVPFIQKRKIIDYDGANRIAVVDHPWNAEYLPTSGDTYVLSTGREDRRVTINPAMQLLDYLTNERYGRGLNLDDDIDLDSFKEAARQCDTRSKVTVIVPAAQSITPTHVMKYPASGDIQFQGTVESVSDIRQQRGTGTQFKEVVFKDVIGKLGMKWQNWKTFGSNQLVWNDGAFYAITGLVDDASNLGTALTSLSLTNTSDSNASVPIDVGQTATPLVSADGNPLVKSFIADDPNASGTLVGTFVGSGYDLYDADGVKFWKYVGWDDDSQRNATRHQMNHVVSTSNPVFDNINLMLNQFNGILRYSNGKYSLDIRSKSPDTFQDEEIIEESDIIGTISLKDGGIKKAYNSVNARIKDPQLKFESRSVSFFNSEYLKEDRNIAKQGTYGVPGITNYYNARLNIKQRLDESRFGITISFKMMPKGALLLPGSIIRINYPRFGYSNKEFRITNIITNTDCTINITAEEHNNDAYLVQSIAKPRFGNLKHFIESEQVPRTFQVTGIAFMGVSGSKGLTGSGSALVDLQAGNSNNSFIYNTITGGLVESVTDSTPLNQNTANAWANRPEGSFNKVYAASYSGKGTAGSTTAVVTLDPDSIFEFPVGETSRLPLAGGTLTGQLNATDVSIEGNLKHTGDSDTQIEFDSNQIRFKAGDASLGGERLKIDATDVTVKNSNLKIIGVTASSSPKLTFTGTNEASAGDVVGQIDFFNSDTTDNTPGIISSIKAIAGASGGEGSLQFLTDMPSEGTAANKIALHLHSNATVGIGTDTPAHTLDILRSTNGDATINVKSTAAGDPTLRFDSAAANRNAVIRFMDQGSLVGGRIQYVHNGDRMDFQSGSSTGATLSVLNNRVIIGDTGSHTSDRLQIETPASGGGQGIQIRRNDANGDQQLGRIDFGNNTDTDLARIAAKTDGDSNAGDSGALLFSTQVTSGSLAERMRITSTGKVLFKGAAQTGYALFDDGVNGGIHLKSDTSSVTTEYITTGFGAFEEARFVASNFVFKNSGTSTRAVIDTSGNFLVGTTNTTWQTVEGLRYFAGNSLIVTRDSDEPMSLNRLTNDGDVLIIRKDGTANGSIGVNGGDVYIGTGDTNVLFADGSDSIIPANTGGASRDNAIDLGASGTRFKDIHSVRALIPKVGFDDVGIRFDNSFDAVIPYRPDTDADSDDRMDLGRYNARWDDVFATNGTIQTSDQDEKQDFEALSDAEKRVAVAAKGLLKKFRWKSAVTEKGDNARIHFGIVAQELEAAFTAEGLDAGRYGMFISNTWTEDGIEKTRRGVRYHELLAFIIASI